MFSPRLDEPRVKLNHPAAIHSFVCPDHQIHSVHLTGIRIWRDWRHTLSLLPLTLCARSSRHLFKEGLNVSVNVREGHQGICGGVIGPGDDFSH